MPKATVNHKTVLFWFFFICIDFFIAAGLSELWIRFFIPVKNICYYHDPVLGDMFCPNQSTYGYVEKGYTNIFKNNSHGFHDIERTKEKKENSLRIHIYGDSLTAAAAVPIDKTIPSLLESYINAGHPPTSVEVLNMASAEDSTVTQFLTYQHIGKDFSPDIVICYFMSDYHDNIFETHQRTRSPYYDMDENGALIFIPPQHVDVTSPFEQFKRSSLLYRHLANKFLESTLYFNLSQGLQRLPYFLHLKKTDNLKKASDLSDNRKKIMREKAWPITLRLLQEFKKEVSKNGARFILIDGRTITDEFGGVYTNHDLELFCKENSIPYIAAFAEYEQLRKGKDNEKYFLNDGHPTIHGNEIISNILTQKLTSLIFQPQP
jgi:hypothetical protein